MVPLWCRWLTGPPNAMRIAAPGGRLHPGVPVRAHRDEVLVPHGGEILVLLVRPIIPSTVAEGCDTQAGLGLGLGDGL